MVGDIDALGRGAYGATEAMRLINFQRPGVTSRGVEPRSISRSTVARWLYGYTQGVTEAAPLWEPDYPIVEDDYTLEVSFRDLIELRFVKTFRDMSLSLQTIRKCFDLAVEAVHDQRPFSTQRFRTDGETIFLEITNSVDEGKLLDLKRRQNAFHRIVEPSLHDLEFDAEVLARWYPLGTGRKSVVVDPARSFGRPIVAEGGVPTETLWLAAKVEGSVERVAKLYELPAPAVRDAIAFQDRLAA